MVRRLIVTLILLVVVFVNSGVAFADPPDAVRVQMTTYPPEVHVGDPLTLRCEIIPLRGAQITSWGVGFTGGLLIDDLDVTRSFEVHGPVVFNVPLNTSQAGIYTAGCNGNARLDGQNYLGVGFLDIEILP